MASELPYKILDADNHFTEPPNLYQDFIDPSKRDLAITFVKTESGQEVQLFAGKPSKFTVEGFSEGIAEMQRQDGLDTSVDDEGFHLPGRLLSRLNPLKGLSDAEKREVIESFRHQSEAFGNRELRLALMDEQGIEAALMYPASAHDIEFEFADDVDAMYANVRAFNRWIHEEIGYAAENRMFLPPYLALADVDLALAELEIIIETGAPMLQIKSGHAHGGRDNPFGGRSPADPIFDPIWSRVNEAGMRLCVHLGATDYQKYGADWSEDPERTFGQFSNFQWVMYWGDRPAMELTAGLILQDFFGRFPNIKVCLSEMGTVWVPYTTRQDGPLVHDGTQVRVREARSPAVADLPGALHRGPVPRGERHACRCGGGDRADRVRFGLPARRGSGLSRRLCGCAAVVIRRGRPAAHHARQPGRLPASPRLTRGGRPPSNSRSSRHVSANASTRRW